MTERTIIGKRYVVESAAGCVVTSGRGRVLCDVAPGMAGKFVATDGRVVCSDPLAVVREAQELEALPASGWFLYELSRELVGVLVGTTYRLWWREGLNKLFIMTQLTTDDLNEQVLAVAAKYVPEGVTAEVYNVNKYAHCVNMEDILAVNSDYKNDLTSEGEWIYPLPMLKNSKNLFKESPVKKFLSTLPALEEPTFLFQNSESLEDIYLELPKAKYLDRTVSDCDSVTSVELKFAGQNLQYMYDAASRNKKVKHIKITGVGECEFSSSFHYSPELEIFEIEAKKIKGLHGAFSSDYKLHTVIFDSSEVKLGLYAFPDCRALKTFPTNYPKLDSGSFMFHGCQLNATHAIEILNSIPSYTSGSHAMHIGIHIDHQNDADVLAAIANAEAKGWTLTVQWNGTPSAKASTTYRMRRQQPMYAKLAEDTEWPDGTIRPTLDWGHYVTNWEENGYQEFASIDEAKEYFNITE